MWHIAVAATDNCDIFQRVALTKTAQVLEHFRNSAFFFPGTHHQSISIFIFLAYSLTFYDLSSTQVIY